VRRHPLTMDEIIQAFRDEPTRRHKQPSEAQLGVLLLNLCGPIAQLDLEALAALGPISRAAADFSHNGWHTYQAIEAIAAIRPDWLTEIPVLAKIREALQEAVQEGLLEPIAPQRRRGSGRRSLPGLDLSAYFVATVVQRCVQDANPLREVSLTSALGPVVSIGAKLFARLQGQRIVQPATFRTHVQKGRTFASRLVRNLSQ
jgi:hypothetical protein